MERNIEELENQFLRIQQEIDNLKQKIQNLNSTFTSSTFEKKQYQYDYSYTENVNRLIKYCHENKLQSARFKQVLYNYYDKPLENRRKCLNASTTGHLCKSMIIINTQCTRNDCEDKKNSKYYMVVLQYTSKINSDKIMRVLRELNQGKIGKSHFSISLADLGLSEEMTGFKRNAITPIASYTKIPIILSQGIYDLNPNFFWLGGGEVDVKIELSVDEFVKHYNPIIAYISDEIEI